MLKLVRLLSAVAVAVSLAACSGVSSPSSLSTENFSGTLDPQSTATQNFSVGKTGELQMTLQSLTPRPVLGFLSLAIGTASAGGCSPMLGYGISQAAIGTQYSFPRIVKGSYCIMLYDSTAILTSPVAWTLRLSHP